jgi:hypothetical protein
MTDEIRTDIGATFGFLAAILLVGVACVIGWHVRGFTDDEATWKASLEARVLAVESYQQPPAAKVAPDGG